jgi:hypothetical protein
MSQLARSLEQPVPWTFRWQYLHVIGAECMANAVLHETDIFGLRRSPYVSLCHDANGVPEHARRSLSSTGDGTSRELHPTGGIRLSRDGCSIDLSAGASQLVGRARPTEGRTSGAFNTTLLELDGKKSYWQVLTVGERFDGVIRSENGSRPVSGAFYMDRQWGDLTLQSVVQDWIWGHLVSRNMELVYFHVFTREGLSSVRVMVRLGDNWTVSERLSSSYLEAIRVRPLANLDAEFELSVRSPAVAVGIRISPDNLVRLRDRERHCDFSASYARWRTGGWVSTGSSRNERIYGVTEHLRIVR